MIGPVSNEKGGKARLCAHSGQERKCRTAIRSLVWPGGNRTL